MALAININQAKILKNIIYLFAISSVFFRNFKTISVIIFQGMLAPQAHGEILTRV